PGERLHHCLDGGVVQLPDAFEQAEVATRRDDVRDEDVLDGILHTVDREPPEQVVDPPPKVHVAGTPSTATGRHHNVLEHLQAESTGLELRLGEQPADGSCGTRPLEIT